MYTRENELIHWGVKGMKWGIRRYQNKDGSLTRAGKRRKAQEEYERDVEKKRDELDEEIYKHDSKSQYKKAEELALKKGYLYKNYAKDSALGASIVSAVYLAPAAMYISGKVAKRCGAKGMKRVGVGL